MLVGVQRLKNIGNAVYPVSDEPFRSRLYNLVPMGVGTFQIESLTSYVNRLAWLYYISPRMLVAHEIIPNLKVFQSVHANLGAFGRSKAMSINGSGSTASDWSGTLERLTMRSDLQNLTLRYWSDELSLFDPLRANPGWCSACYHDWKERKQPIYQPLQWMLRIVTVCTKHRRRLEEYCPYCYKNQSIFATKSQLGWCTQCNRWLGLVSEAAEEVDGIDDETLNWHKWVVNVLGELHTTSSKKVLTLERLAIGLAECIEVVGSIQRFSRITDVPFTTIEQWLNNTRRPSLERLLALCYAINVSPLQLVTLDSMALQERMQSRRIDRQLRSRRTPYPRVSRDRAFELIKAVLDGREEPLAMGQIGRRLGIGLTTLRKLFPQEYALVVAKYKAYRSEQKERRIAQACNMVRQATISLFMQGINPSYSRVASMLSRSSMLRGSKARSTWHAVRRELGLE